MSFFKTRADYFLDLSINNKLVAHTRNVSGEVRNSFFRLNDEEELVAACVNWAHFPCVVHFGYAGRYSQRPNELNKRRINNALAFLDKVDDVHSMAQRETAKDRSFEVMEQYIAWMLEDFESKGQCSNFGNLDLSLFAFEEYGPVGATLYGWLLTFTDEQMDLNVIQYDESKWYDPL